MNYTYRNKNSDAGGSLETQTIGATAGNDIFNATPGTGKRWVLLYGKIILVAVGAGNRAIRVQLTDGTDVLVEYYQTGNITAGQTKVLNLAGWGMNPGNLTGVNDFIQGIGKAILEGDDQFRIVVGGGIAADSYSGYLRVLEYSI
jgi:hypothetical protein